jgi:flagellar hook-basal body complex protein FliE
MNVSPIASFGGLPLANGIDVAPPASNGGLFGNLVGKFIEDTNQAQLQADQSVARLATGESESVHETMLALAKADLSLRVFMEVRNKVIDAYTQVMQTQM